MKYEKKENECGLEDFILQKTKGIDLHPASTAQWLIDQCCPEPPERDVCREDTIAKKTSLKLVHGEFVQIFHEKKSVVG